MHKRSIIKAFTWRILATLTTTILVFIFTRNLTLAGIVSFFDFHERVWNKTNWGRKK